MATNPQLPEQYPEEDRPRDEHPKMPPSSRSGFPWPLLIIVVAAVILAALIYWLPRQPKRAMAPSAAVLPAQPTGDQIQLADLKVMPDPTRSSAYVSARLMNLGTNAINGAAVEGSFKDATGRTVATLTGKVLGVVGNPQAPATAAVNSGAETQDLTQAPIKPNEGRPVRIYFEGIPQGWNGQIPDLRIVQVTAVGAGK